MFAPPESFTVEPIFKVTRLEPVKASRTTRDDETVARTVPVEIHGDSARIINCQRLLPETLMLVELRMTGPVGFRVTDPPPEVTMPSTVAAFRVFLGCNTPAPSERIDLQRGHG
jgi:hypothetical protein